MSQAGDNTTTIKTTATAIARVATTTPAEKIVEHFIAASCLPDACNISNEKEREREEEGEKEIEIASKYPAGKCGLGIACFTFNNSAGQQQTVTYTAQMTTITQRL